MRPLLERLRDPARAEADEKSSLGDLCREAATALEQACKQLSDSECALLAYDEKQEADYWKNHPERAPLRPPMEPSKSKPLLRPSAGSDAPEMK